MFIQNRWNLSQWKFYRVASETVIEWKFCSKGIKFLSIWNTSERSSRVVRVEQYRFRNVERNRIAWVCALYVVLFLPFPFFFFFCFSLFSYLSTEDREIELNRCWERKYIYIKQFIVTKNNTRNINRIRCLKIILRGNIWARKIFLSCFQIKSVNIQ